MCTVSTVIDGWWDPSWPPLYPGPHVQPVTPTVIPKIEPGPNAVPWPVIQQDPALAQQMLEILAKLESIDKRLGQLEQCKVTREQKKSLKRKLRRIAKRK